MALLSLVGKAVLDETAAHKSRGAARREGHDGSALAEAKITEVMDQVISSGGRIADIRRLKTTLNTWALHLSAEQRARLEIDGLIAVTDRVT